MSHHEKMVSNQGKKNYKSLQIMGTIGNRGKVIGECNGRTIGVTKTSDEGGEMKKKSIKQEIVWVQMSEGR